MTPKRHAIAQGVLKTSLSNTTLLRVFFYWSENGLLTLGYDFIF